MLFGFIAACTRTIELTTGIIILPQRQTALAAKQAAEVDMLSGGRLRLGLGVGWNPLEYEALGEDFHTRGKRMDEQIPLMQRLWTERHVSGQVGREVLADVGFNPPAIRSIPIWLGGKGPAAVRRAVAWGSGLILSGRTAMPDAEAEFTEVRDRLYAAADAAGRPREELGIEVWLATKDGDPDSWRADVETLGGARRDPPERADLRGEADHAGRAHRARRRDRRRRHHPPKLRDLGRRARRDCTVWTSWERPGVLQVRSTCGDTAPSPERPAGTLPTSQGVPAFAGQSPSSLRRRVT